MVAVEDLLLVHEIERTLFREARLLDERRYRDWLAMLTDDVSYWMPIRSTRTAAESADEFTKPGDAAHFDEDRGMLETRIFKLETGYSWAEDPPSRTRHCVSNVEILERHSPAEVTAGCNFVIFRSRLDDDENWWVGRRVDRLRNEGGTWKIAAREIYLDHTVLTAKNLSTFL